MIVVSEVIYLYCFKSQIEMEYKQYLLRGHKLTPSVWSKSQLSFKPCVCAVSLGCQWRYCSRPFQSKGIIFWSHLVSVLYAIVKFSLQLCLMHGSRRGCKQTRTLFSANTFRVSKALIFFAQLDLTMLLTMSFFINSLKDWKQRNFKW